MLCNNGTRPYSYYTAIFLVFLFCLLTNSARAQEKAPSGVPEVVGRPKVGVVLSGGAAYGFAHHGVMRWLEHNRIPVDYISGTSMGSLVGGFYATGMSAEEIDQLLGPLDWDGLFRSVTPPLLRDFRRREDYRTFQNDLEFGRHFASTTGLNSAHPIGLLLSKIALPYSDTLTFDDLPIPFRCVAVDLNNAHPVTFESGPLALAMRASMAIPFVFTTVERDGKTFVDGGVFDNLPVQMMLPGESRPRGWSPEVIVSVRLEDKNQPGDEPGEIKQPSKLSTAPSVSERPSNALDVVSRLIAAITTENVQRSIKQIEEAKNIASVPLVANVTGFTPEDFARWRELAKRGEAAAEANKAVLLKYQLSVDDWKIYQDAKNARRRRSFTPEGLVFTEQDPQTMLPYNLRVSLRNRLKPFVGRPLTAPLPPSKTHQQVVEQLDGDINDLYGTGLFESISYGQTRLADKPALAVRAQRKSYGPPFFLVGLELNSGDAIAPESSLHLRYNGTGQGLEGSDEIRGDLILGSRPFAGVEYYHLLNRRGLFVVTQLYYRRELRDLTVEKRDGGRYTIAEGSAGVDIGRNFGKSAQARLGVLTGRRSYTVPANSLFGENARGTATAVTGRWTIDMQNDPVTPRNGIYATVRAVEYLKFPGSSPFGQVEATISAAAALTARASLQLSLRTGRPLSGHAPPPEQFLLGGANHVTSLVYGELRGERYEYGSLGVLYRVTPSSSIIGGALHVGVWVETAEVSRDDDSKQRHSDLHLGAILPTRFGPISAGIGLGNAGRRRIYINIGRIF